MSSSLADSGVDLLVDPEVDALVDSEVDSLVDSGIDSLADSGVDALVGSSWDWEQIHGPHKNDGPASSMKLEKLFVHVFEIHY